MRRNQAYPSMYFSQEDVRTAPVRATIEDVRIETLGRSDDADEKPVIHFREKNLKNFPLNLTNWQTIEAAYGPESDEWRGKTIELYLDPGIKFGRETVGGVRIRIPGGAVPPSAAPLSWDDAVALARLAGLEKDALTAALKAKGLAGYSPRRDTALVRSIIAAHHAGGPSAADGEDLDDVIPF